MNPSLPTLRFPEVLRHIVIEFVLSFVQYTRIIIYRIYSNLAFLTQTRLLRRDTGEPSATGGDGGDRTRTAGRWAQEIKKLHHGMVWLLLLLNPHRLVNFLNSSRLAFLGLSYFLRQVPLSPRRTSCKLDDRSASPAAWLLAKIQHKNYREKKMERGTTLP